ncbi:hypothetical protein [Actinomyces ruminis]|uniref:hypothetical protein n=1 Tax=Actinomyces ruminis TaxID=1937003 RepID=UPI001C558271|nr:hypothetical protein [Actinomyces ruminis]
MLLKNQRAVAAGGGDVDDAGSVLPLGAGVHRVWVPTRHVGAQPGFMRGGEPARDVDPFDAAACPWARADDPRQADAAVVFIESPLSNPYSTADRDAGGNGYLPLTLQYRPYTAAAARPRSLAAGDFRETGDRAYRGKTNRAANETDLDAVIAAREVLGERPVIVVVRMHNPAVLAELEPTPTPSWWTSVCNNRPCGSCWRAFSSPAGCCRSRCRSPWRPWRHTARTCPSTMPPTPTPSATPTPSVSV